MENKKCIFFFLDPIKLSFFFLNSTWPSLPMVKYTNVFVFYDDRDEVEKSKD